MSARDRILARIRRAATPADPPTRLQPDIARTEGEAAVERFMAQARKVAASVSRLDRLSDLPAAVADELRKRNLPAAIRTGTDPAFARDWGTVEHTTGPGRIEEPATLTRAELAVAETGQLVFASGPDNPVTLNYLGDTHFAVIEASRIVGGFETLWPRWRALGLDPRTVNLIAGPSRSGDIGQVLQMGAHGPVALHVFVVDDMTG